MIKSLPTSFLIQKNSADKFSYYFLYIDIWEVAKGESYTEYT